MENAKKTNLVLEQYGRFKRQQLDELPFSFLRNIDSSLNINRHQVLAFCHAIDALTIGSNSSDERKTGGIILADEVGLGKTIEAGFVLQYMIRKGARYVMIITPASLRMQWKVELEEKFGIKAVVADRTVIEGSYSARKLFSNWITGKNHRIPDDPCIVIASYDFSSKLMERYSVNWDFCIIDEAHNLRNVYHSGKRAKRILDLTAGIPKILLTATPIQNRIEDLFGLVSFIDSDIFLNEKVFLDRFGREGKADELKKTIAPIIQRTLRRDVPEIQFSRRVSRTYDFSLSPEEQELYDKVDAFLKRPWLNSIPKKNRGLINLVIRKILASSSFAVADTFYILKDRLRYAYQDAKDISSEETESGIDFLLAMLDDELESGDFDSREKEPEENEKQRTIKEEGEAIDAIIRTAESIHANSKIEALKTALDVAFSSQREKGIPEKAVIFTESRRTQEYIVSELSSGLYDRKDILLFNGSNSGEQEDNNAYIAWKMAHPNESRAVAYRQAIIERFRKSGKILVSTDAGSEGLNLQFCNTVINYDLPWNPQKIEQRIGRCHRYGQRNDVVAISLINRDNEADKRVYEILSRKFQLFDDVFGSSDSALGLIESGTSFEKDILRIYQECNTVQEADKAFDKLEEKLNRKSRKGIVSILDTKDSFEKSRELEDTASRVAKYLGDCRFWEGIPEPDINDEATYYWKNTAWGEETVGAHGILFVGVFGNGGKLLSPVLDLFDDRGEEAGFSEDEIVEMLESFDDDKTYEFHPSAADEFYFSELAEKIRQNMENQYLDSIKPLIRQKHEMLVNQMKNRISIMKINMSELSEKIHECNEKLNTPLTVPDRMSIEREKQRYEKRLNDKNSSFKKKCEITKNDYCEREEKYRESLEISSELRPLIILRF